MKIVCCSLQMAVEKMGVDVIEYTRDCKPYALWKADLYKCRDPLCGREVVSAFGLDAWKRQHDEGFARAVVAVLERDNYRCEFK